MPPPPTMWPLFLAGIILCWPVEGASQMITGRVQVMGDTTGVPGVDLVLADSAGTLLTRVQADGAGRFRLPVIGSGVFQIRASRIGFSAVAVDVSVMGEELVEIELRMAEKAIPLEPLVIVGRREIKKGTLDEFYDRMARMKQQGVGEFLTREQIEELRSTNLAMLLQTMQGIWLDHRGTTVSMLSSTATTSGGVFCNPDYYLDGVPLLDGFREIYTLDLEGVEVYRGYSESIRGYWSSRCGMVFLWRKADWGAPITWKRTLIAGGLLALILIL
jgi:hypothetical protein